MPPACSVDSLHKLNLTPSPGLEAESGRFLIGPDQALSWDLPGLPGEETRAVQEPCVQRKPDSYLGCGKSTFHFKCVWGVICSERSSPDLSFYVSQTY